MVTSGPPIHDAVSYPFEDIGDTQFESVVLQCMKKLFGAGVQGFSTGPDGGRDARFVGTAERFPSAASPWIGTTIGQAKHTVATNTHYSDPAFSSSAKSSVLSKEIVRITKLVEAAELDNYILFSNRRLGGVVGPKLTKALAETTGIPPAQVHLAGVEYLDDLLFEYPDILRLAKVDPVDGPLLVSSADLAEVILAIADELNVSPAPEDPPPVLRVTFREKNAFNSMSAEFADQLSRRYLGRTAQIDDFLADPGNTDLLARYEATVEDFQLKIVAKRKDHQSFDDVFNHLVEVLVSRDGVLRDGPITRSRDALLHVLALRHRDETSDAHPSKHAHPDRTVVAVAAMVILRCASEASGGELRRSQGVTRCCQRSRSGFRRLVHHPPCACLSSWVSSTIRRRWTLSRTEGES